MQDFVDLCRSQSKTTEVSESPESPPPFKKQKVDKDVAVKLQKGTSTLVAGGVRISLRKIMQNLVEPATSYSIVY